MPTAYITKWAETHTLEISEENLQERKDPPAKIEMTHAEWVAALRAAFYDGWECGWCASDMASLLTDEEKGDSWETSKTKEVAFSARPSATKGTE